MNEVTGKLPGWDERQPEHDEVECEVVGDLPPGLDGALYRLGGAWYYPPKYADDVLLHADGIASRFRVSGGRVTYRSRYVETERLVANRDAGRMRFGHYRNRFMDDDDVAHLSASAANTTAFAFAGRLLALKEDGLPYELDPETLATRGTFDFGGAVESVTFTAHPMIDGKTGELVAFGYQAAGNYSPDCHAWVFHPDGRLKHEIRIDVPWLDMIHDMVITENHILLPLGGYTTSEAAARQGGAMWQWDPHAPARIAVFRRDGDGSDLRWFTGPKSCQLHTFNAWEDGDRIVFDAPFYCGNPFPFLKSADGSPWSPEYGKAYLRRLTFDLADGSETWREELLFAQPMADLGDVDPRVVGHRHRYCYGGRREGEAPASTSGWISPNAWVRFDVAERTSVSLVMPAHYGLGECRFVPRSPDAPEGEGWLVGVAFDRRENRSELLVADAADLAAGPVARAILPFPAAPQVHGNWASAGAMGLDPLA